MLAARSAVIAFAACAGAASPVLAWNAHGHEMIAWIAWQDLKPEAKTRVTAILKQHPQREKLEEGCPDGYDKDLYVFMRAATWPDLIRKSPDDRPKWHYINLPIGPQAGNHSAPQVNWKPGNQPDNAVEGIAWAEHELKTESTSDKDKAVAICWLLHLIGDIHQPLHATTFFSPQFKDGDRGGNNFFVEFKGNPRELHKIWDAMLGDDRGQYTDTKTVPKDAEEVRRENPRSSMTSVLAEKSPEGWAAKESKPLAQKVAYDNEQLKGVYGDDNNKPASAPALPAGYLDKAKTEAAKRGAAAGYRIADRLGTITN